MQKIIIKNFGPVKDAEIDIKKTLILIGEQASGKSTIAKLIYFFRTLQDEINSHFINFLNSSSNEAFSFNESRDLINPIKRKFYTFFGTTNNRSKFVITFFYDSELKRSLEISFNKEKSLSITFSPDFFIKDWEQKITTKINDLNNLRKAGSVHIELKKSNINPSLSLYESLLDNAFISNNREYGSLFVIAGRNATVQYSSLFEKYLFADIQKRVAENSKSEIKLKDQTVDEVLMLEFIKKIEYNKSKFEYNGGSFQSIVDLFSNVLDNHNMINLILVKINQILKGTYKFDGSKEKIIFNNNNFVSLHDASSGQQESIRILQDIFLVILEKEKVFRVIEEPEAHLFPEAQKLLVELFAILVNAQLENELIITTHSPYILTAYNNLLFANRVIQKNEELKEEVYKNINEECILDSKDFAAYGLKIVQSEDDVYCQSIVDEEMGLIDQNFLDSVSDTLNDEFHNLYDLYAKSFTRQ